MAKKAATKRVARRKPARTAAKGAQSKPKKALPEPAGSPALSGLDPLQFIKEFDEQLDTLLDVKQSLETELANTQDMITAQRRARDDMTRQLQELENDVQRQASVRNELEFLQSETAKASDELKGLREQLEEKDATVAGKDKHIAELTAKDKGIRGEIAALKELRGQGRSERTESDSHLQVAKLERSELAVEIRKQRELLAKEEESGHTVDAELDRARMAMSKLHGSFEVSKRKAERILKK